MATGLSALRHDHSLAWNLLWQLEHDFLIYGKYNVEKLQDIVMTINNLQNRTLSIERLLTGQDLQTLQVAHLAPDVISRMTFIHKFNLYVQSMLERQIRLYEWLLHHLQDLLDSIGTLSTGHLPPELFPPTVLQNVTANTIEMVLQDSPWLCPSHQTHNWILWYEITAPLYHPVSLMDDQISSWPTMLSPQEAYLYGRCSHGQTFAQPPICISPIGQFYVIAICK